MELIKLLFFAIGSFFGMENSNIAATETIVTIHPIEKTIRIEQKNIIALLLQENDSVLIRQQLVTIKNQTLPWSEDLKDYPKTKLSFSEGEDHTLHCIIELHYNTPTDLRPYGISIQPEGKYSLTNIPSWDIKTEDGVLNGNYWNFEPNAPFTFSIASLKDIPPQYASKVVSLLPYWKDKN